MKIETLRKHYETRPFRPFVIHSSDGQKAKVVHPEFMSFSFEGDYVVVTAPGDVGYRLIDVSSVRQVEVAIPRSPKRRQRAA